MKKANSIPNVNVPNLTIVLFGMLYVIIGCGSSEDDNNQPSIETRIRGTNTDHVLTLAVNAKRMVNIYITDADVDDTHKVSASSENTTVATVSVDDTMYQTALTITGRSVGVTIVTLTATDDSGEENAAASLVFQVTVVEPHLIGSTPMPLTELPLKGGVVTLTLVGLTYTYGLWPTVDGIRNYGRIESGEVDIFEVGRVSDTVIQLTFLDNFDTAARLTFTVHAHSIAEYDGPALTAQLPVTDAIVQGPWLWMAVPTDPSVGGGVSTEIDSLAEASDNAISETEVVKHGVNEGDSIDRFQWTAASIGYEHAECEKFCGRTIFAGCVTLCWFNNINDILNALGFGTGGSIKAHTAYALINLVSPSNQDDAVIGVKSGDAMKIWLNGEVIHREAATLLECRSFHVGGATDPYVCTSDPHYPKKSVFPVKLKAGNNLLLVKVRQHGDYWGMRVQLSADFTTEIPKR